MTSGNQLTRTVTQMVAFCSGVWLKRSATTSTLSNLAILLLWMSRRCSCESVDSWPETKVVGALEASTPSALVLATLRAVASSGARAAAQPSAVSGLALCAGPWALSALVTQASTRGRMALCT